MSSENIQVDRRNHGDDGEYVVKLDNAQEAARLTWKSRGGTRHADHTFVPSAMRGQGIAEKLVQALISDAKSEGFKIAPNCSYVAAQFDKHPEWADLRA